MLETTCVEDDVDCVRSDVQELPSTALTLFPTPTLIGSHIHSEAGEVLRLPVCVADEFYKGKL